MATAKNTNQINFQAAPSGAVGETMSHIGFWDAATSGNFLWGASITGSPGALALGDVLYIAGDGLTLTQATATGETGTSAVNAIKGRIGDGVWLAAHDGNPGLTGASPMTLTRVALTESSFTFDAS